MPRGGAKPGERRGGRKKGSRNKATIAVQAVARAFVDDPVYREMLLQRLRDGTLSSAVETMLWAYGYGRPVGDTGDGQTLPASITIHF